MLMIFSSRRKRSSYDNFRRIAVYRSRRCDPRQSVWMKSNDGCKKCGKAGSSFRALTIAMALHYLYLAGDLARLAIANRENEMRNDCLITRRTTSG